MEKRELWLSDRKSVVREGLRVNQFKCWESNSTGGGRLLFKTVKLLGRSFLLLLLACQTTQLSAQHEAGDLEELGIPNEEVGIPNADISIRFRYCPKTTESLVTGDPGVPKPPRFATNGFWLSEMEITQAEYAAVMGATELTKVKERLDRMAPAIKANVGGEYWSGGEKPVYLLTMPEVVAFCVKLERLVRKTEGDEVEKSRFRIPSQFEWQYACRGRVGPEAAEFPHFSGWSEAAFKKEIPTDWPGSVVKNMTLKAYCELMIKEKKLKIPGVEIVKAKMKMENDKVVGFTGTQLQVMEICKADEKLARMILGELLNLKYDLWDAKQAEVERKPEDWQRFSKVLGEASGGTPNNWKLRHMQTNVYEWGVFSESPDLVEINRTWANLKEKGEGTKGTILGAGFMTADWERYRIWNHNLVEYTDLFPLPEEVDETGSKQKAGIRLLRVKELVQDWLVMIRKAAITNPIPELDHAKLSEYSRSIPDKLPVAAEATLARGQIDYYRALAYLRAKDTDNAMKAFKEAEPVIVKDDNYFKFLSVVLSEDGK